MSVGSIRVVNKRKEPSAVLARADEQVIDIDRTHPVLGNRHVLKNHRDPVERDQVIAAHAVDFEEDWAVCGPMFLAVRSIADRVASGQRIALRCWCAPRKCHGDLYRKKIMELAGIGEDEFDIEPVQGSFL